MDEHLYDPVADSAGEGRNSANLLHVRHFGQAGKRPSVSGGPPVSYTGWGRLLLCLLTAGGLWVLPQTGSLRVYAATCTPVAAPAAETAPSSGFSTAANVIATFDTARQAEGCSVPLSINQTAFNAATPQTQMLMLFNAERQDRGLPALSLDSTLMSQIDLNHSREMVQYGYFNHPSPINQPGPSNVFKRLTVNPAIAQHATAVSENIAGGTSMSTAAQAVYTYMYQDSASSWGHRHNILGYNGSTGAFGNYDWVGIGIATGGQYGYYYTSDFLQDATSSRYSPPGPADTQPPSLTPPTITSGAAGGTVGAQTTNVQDTGAPAGAAGVTGVVFYANAITMDAYGNANTVVGTQSSPGVWTASLSFPAGGTLHAVAVDGSGNYTDCPATASACGAPPPTTTCGTGSSVTIQAGAGWNLVGGSPLTLWSDASVSWAWNASTGQWYHPTSSASCGTGSWEDVSTAGPRTVTVWSCSSPISVSVVAHRWNLVGNPCSTPVTLPGTARAYWWDPSATHYDLVTSINPGAAAWVKPDAAPLILTP